MINRINVLRLGRLARWLLGGAPTCALLLAAATVPPDARATCAGRSLLTCGEKVALYDDSVTWTLAYVRDVEPFEAPIPLGLRNPALGGFWRFEAATATARALFEVVIGNQETDQNFEATATRANLPAPSVRPSGVVDRQLAATLSRLMLAEQQEVLNLGGMATALNRATAAQIERSRPDWVAWQEATAAGFAVHAAAAIGRVARAQRSVASLLLAKRLVFGVGSVDLQVAQRAVRHHGFARPLAAIMRRLGLSELLIAYAQKGFVNGTFGAQSFSLTRELSAPTTSSYETALARSLRQFAAATPSAKRPS